MCEDNLFYFVISTLFTDYKPLYVCLFFPISEFCKSLVTVEAGD